MTTAATLTAILSLILTLGGSSGVTEKKSSDETLQTSKDTNSGTIWGTLNGVNLNHNESLIRETTVNQPAQVGTLSMSDKQEFTVAGLLFQFAMYTGIQCLPLVCGSNHNETFVRERATNLTSGLTCSPWVCGSNHNETLLAEPSQEVISVNNAENWNLWPAFSFLSFIGGTCAPMECGANHNETLVRDGEAHKMIWRNPEYSDAR